ncbi:MAG TPA: MMPL family transporter [Gemmataceae bacterium]|nr:MMPL family transporter [Gemmataceae bacterium]
MNSEQDQAKEAFFLHRQLVHLVAAAIRKPKLILGIALACCALSLYGFSTHLEYRTERTDLLNPQKDYLQRWRKYLEEFGEDDDIVIVVKGSDSQRMKEALESLADRVRQQPEHFDRLFFKVDLRHLRNRALMFLPPGQIQQIQDNLKSMSMLLDFGTLGWRNLTLLQLVNEAGHRARKLDPEGTMSAADEQFFKQLLSISRSATTSLAGPAGYRNPWNSLLENQPEQKDLLADPQYFFSGDGSLAFLLARPKKEKGTFTGAQNSVEAMRHIVTEVRTSYPDLDIGLTGLPVLETDEMVLARKDTDRASWLAVAGVTLLFFIVYRSIYYPLLTVGTLLIGTSWAMGWMTLTVGHLNILSATFAVMLIGMGDYGVLWVMRYERERRSGADVVTALRRTSICVGAGTLTAALTTALAFYAAMLADFQAVAELGWIAGSGVLLCALSCFTVLPALLSLFDRRDFSRAGSENESIIKLQDYLSSRSPSTRETWLPGLARRSGWVLASSLAVTVVLAVCAGRVSYDHNLLHLQACDLDSVKWEMTLIEHTAGASWHSLSYTKTPEEALALKERYEKLPEVSRVVEMASLVPAQQDQKKVMLEDIQRRLRWLPDRGEVIPHDLAHIGLLKKELALVAGLLQPIVEAGKQPLVKDLHQGMQILQAKLKEGHAPAIQEFEQRMAGDLAGDLHRLRDVARPEEITLDDLPPPLRERYIGKTGKWLVQVFGKKSLWDFEPLEHFTRQIQTIDPEATGKPFSTVDGLRSLKSAFQWAGVYAFLAIVFVLWFDFRNLKQTLVALSPLAMGLTLALGIMGFFGVPLNPANMIALPLVLGVGVDNGVHILHDFLARKTEGRGLLSRAIGRGVLVKALTTMLGLGTLMISNQPGPKGLGFALALGVACCMVSALVFLPALLRFGKAIEMTAPEVEPGGDERQNLAA